jgi:Zn-dependent M28 family amino/carboxypeptidase
MEFQGWITEPAAYKLLPDLDGLRKAAQGKDFKPAPLNSSMSLSMPVHVRQFDSVNVIGTLAGTDPRLREQAVLYTAHHDHLGAVKPVPPATDGIYNGANDNASGCATLLAIARALTFAPPRRSTLIAFVTAEEQGLLGSEYLAHHPPIPADRIAVDINFDEINKWGKSRDVRALGLGKSSVDKPLLAAAKEQGRAVTGDVRPDLGQFYRSDQFSLARVGVPGIYLKAGRDFVGKPQGWGDVQLNSYFQRDYHQPSDEYHGDWDLSGDVQDAQLQLVVGLRIANAPAMPTWNPGDEFEKARKTASK